MTDKNRLKISYNKWILVNEPGKKEFVEQRNTSSKFLCQPVISIIILITPSAKVSLKETIDSVLAQSYEKFELCLICSGVKDSYIKNILGKFASQDSRIRVKSLSGELSILKQCQESVHFSQGEFVVFLNCGDTLAPDALFEIAQQFNFNPRIEIAYSDEDCLGRWGRRCKPFFKPDWSPELLLSINYLVCLCALRRNILVKALESNGIYLYETFDCQFWDLCFRLSEITENITHISKILYHKRLRRNVTSSDIVVHEHLHRRGFPAEVSLDPRGQIMIKWLNVTNPKVSIIIASKDNLKILKRCIDSLLQKTFYSNFEVILMDTGSSKSAVFNYYEKLSKNHRVKIIKKDGPFNFSAVCNFGARYATGDLFVFLNNDTEIISSEWLNEIIGWVTQDGIGVVGAKLLKRNNTIQHAGVVIGLSGFVDHIFAGALRKSFGVFGDSEWYRNYLAVTGACLSIRREVFEKVGGFNEKFILFGSDVELCLRVKEYGYRVIYTPYAKLTHSEAATRSALKTIIPQEDFTNAFYYYEDFLRKGDPFYNQNLSLWDTIPYFKSLEEFSPVNIALTTLENSHRYSFNSFLAVLSYDFTENDLTLSQDLTSRNKGYLDIRSINWFIPSSAKYSYCDGIHTIFKFASYLSESKGIISRFVVIGDYPDRKQITSIIDSSFPVLADSEICIISADELSNVGSADATIATSWTTAYSVLRFNKTKRKFYFMQDFEPELYPAGSMSALVEATYWFGFYGIANTLPLKKIYEHNYETRAEFFNLSVDTNIFYPGAKSSDNSKQLTVFFYGHPNSLRSAFELGSSALRRLKTQLGEGVRIISAGSSWEPKTYGLNDIIENLGPLKPEEAAALYRKCDLGLILGLTLHPLYIPLELMASGCLVVTNHNHSFEGLFQDGTNCLLTNQSVSCIADTIVSALKDKELREKITAQAQEMVQKQYSNWQGEIDKIYGFMGKAD